MEVCIIFHLFSLLLLICHAFEAPWLANPRCPNSFRYFTTWFHIFDGSVIFAGFVVDVLLHGILEEVASLVVIPRLWRFFKIVEEFGVGCSGTNGCIGE
jgi:hypothetical protein